MKNITIDFGNIIEEMKAKQIKLCWIHNVIGLFVIDSQNRLYQIETYHCGGFLDKYITEKRLITFTLVPESVSKDISGTKEIWDVTDVHKFMIRQKLT